MREAWDQNSGKNAARPAPLVCGGIPQTGGIGISFANGARTFEFGNDPQIRESCHRGLAESASASFAIACGCMIVQRETLVGNDQVFPAESRTNPGGEASKL